MTQVLSRIYPSQVEQLLAGQIFGGADIIVERLWEEARDSYFQREYLSSVILAGTCAEAAHKFACRSRGMNTQNVRWADLIGDSLANGVINDYQARMLNKIRTDYRNKWVHVDIDEITQGTYVPTTAGTRTVTDTSQVVEVTPDEYRAIFASLAAQQEALDCLWLTAIALFTFYGGMGYLWDPAV